MLHGFHSKSPAVFLRVVAAGLTLASLVLVMPEARAQCAGSGVLVGECSDDRGFEGCCPTQNSVSWCEGNNLCRIDCSNNAGVGSSSCCEVSESAGCCDPVIEACVCSIDDFCCDSLWGAGWDLFCVDIALNNCGGCVGEDCPGAPTFCSFDSAEGFYDCGEAYRPDPTGGAPATCPGTTCTRQCTGRQCGSDGCGGSCGSCPVNHTCTSTGQCQPNSCTPQCAGRQCGSDGCGGTCGPCAGNQICDGNGRCQNIACTPDCDGRQCGPDGCGGTCGNCGPNQQCRVDGVCESTVCVPDCRGRECGQDGCGGECGACAEGAACVSGLCVIGCEPDCAGRFCGDDGCGGTCGECVGDTNCVDGRCQPRCTCQGRECGDDGCGRACGFCGVGTECNLTTYTCEGPQVADPAPVTDVGGGGTVAPRNCPRGQVWNPLVGGCVVDPTFTDGKDDGCGGGSWPLGVMMVLAAIVLPARRRRA
jgi:hypothetical protein